jgi:succinate dehydrogenase/fumarate reductase flavoprotein subunit
MAIADRLIATLMCSEHPDETDAAVDLMFPHHSRNPRQLRPYLVSRRLRLNRIQRRFIVTRKATVLATGDPGRICKHHNPSVRGDGLAMARAGARMNAGYVQFHPTARRPGKEECASWQTEAKVVCCSPGLKPFMDKYSPEWKV